METSSSRDSKSRAVQTMFGTIAGRYDFLNHLLSGNIDRLWRRACVREVSRRLSSSSPVILDIGCGTADLSLAFSGIGEVIGCDFCHPMLEIGKRKVARASTPHKPELLEGDALALPFKDGSFDAVVSAFVIRNLTSVEPGLLEMRRVMRSGGVLGVLDFTMPRGAILGMIYRAYFTRILPRIGRLVSGVDGPYRYLPDSVENFPSPDEMKARIARAGYSEVAYRLLTGGVAVLFTARA